VPENVKKVLTDPKAAPLLENNNLMNGIGKWGINNHFWILCSALREFIAQNQYMPHSGQLPDMTSDSKRYTQLLGVYRFKKELKLNILNLLGKSRRRMLQNCMNWPKKFEKND
jgi:hypothetical protein